MPSYTGSGWYGYTYKTHLNGAQSYFAEIDAPKKLMFTGPAHLERPFRSFHHEILNWYDHWLKGIDTGVMREPPVKFWVMGENKWRQADDWPLPETQWTKLYLRNWERLSPEPFMPASVDQFTPPDAFVQMPPSQTNVVQKLRYLSEPLPHDVLIAGPSVLNLFAAIDQDDTNWIVVLKDVGPDVSVMSVREGERELPEDPARARDHARMAQGLASRARSEALETVEAVASAHARRAAAGGAGRDQRIRHRDHGDRQPVPARPPHLPRDHQSRPAHRRRRRDQRGVCSVSHLQQQDGAAQDLSRRQPAIASACCRSSQTFKIGTAQGRRSSCPRSSAIHRAWP